MSDEAQLLDTPHAEISGHLLAAAETRTRVLDGEHQVPVLSFDLETDSPAHLHVHVEQAFPANQFAQAHAAARRLRKGHHVVVQAPVLALRLVVPDATHIHTDKNEEEPAP